MIVSTRIFSTFDPMRKLLRPLLLLFAVLTIAACEPIARINPLNNSGQPDVDTSQPIPVALLVPRGSGQPSDDLLARNFENAARLAMRDLNGVEIDLRIYGTAANPTQAANAARQAVNDGAVVLLGPLYAEAANAAGLAAASAGVNVLTFSNNPSIAGGNVFILGSTFQNTANRLAGFANRQGRGRVVVVHSNDVAGQLGRNAVQAAIARRGGSLVGAVDYPLSQQGVVSTVPRIRAAVNGGGANAVFLTAPSAGALPLLVQLLPEAGVTSPNVQYIGLTRWDIPPQTLGLPGVQGGWFALPDPNRDAAFRSRYQSAYGGAPHPLAGLAYDGIAAIGALAARKTKNPFAAGSLTQNAGFQGSKGVFRLRPDGTNERGLAVATIQDRRVVVIDPAPSGFGGAGF